MAWTNAEETRIRTIETVLNEIQTALSHMITKDQFRQLMLLRQEEIDSLTRRVVSLESQLTVLQGKLG